MAWFKFNDISSNDLGLIITETPFRPSWAENIEEIKIAGRAEVIKQPTGIYGNQSFVLSATVTDMSKINEIYSILHGEGKLIVSTAPDEYINCRADILIPKAVALDMSELPVTFDCFPFAYSINPTVVAVGKSYTEVKNESSMYSEPVIHIKMKKTSAPILKGDVNFDGKINASDASMVMAEYVRISSGEPGTFTPEQIEAGDMDNDGRISAADASAILQLYADLSANGGNQAETPAQNVEIDVNGAVLIVGIPNEVLTNGFTVTVDCGLHLIYYEDMNGDMVNIMQYSSLDLPLLHEGMNYVRYNGDNVDRVTVTINERWL